MRTSEALDAIKGEWKQLLENADCTVFQTFEWIRAWWNHIGKGNELYCVTFRQAGVLVGIAPLVCVPRKIQGRHPLRHVKVLGYPYSGSEQIIAKKGCESDVIEAFCKHLAEHKNEWDVVDIETLPEGSSGVKLLPEYLDRGNLGYHLYQGSVSVYVPLPDTFEEYLDLQDKHWRHEYRRKWKGLTQQFSVDIEHFHRSESSLHSAMESFFEIHRNRWKNLGYPSDFDKPDVAAFHREVVERFAEEGLLSLSFLTVNGERVAVSLEFLFHDTVAVYQSQAAGTPDVMKFSPAFLLKTRSIERAIADHKRVYDLLRGAFTYKTRDFGAVPRKNWMVRITPPRGERRWRLFLFLADESLQKARRRLQQEIYEGRRVRVMHGGSRLVLARHWAERGRVLMRTGIAYLGRHVRRG